MLNSTVLVLNRSYLPIHVTSVRRAFSLIYQDIARAVNEEYATFDFEAWRGLSAPRGGARAIGTARGAIRVPRVIVLIGLRPHAEAPRALQPRQHLRARQVHVSVLRRQPHRSELNLDHVMPRSLGGKTTWENVVCSCVDCNRRKGGRTPEQARLRLRAGPRGRAGRRS